MDDPRTPATPQLLPATWDRVIDQATRGDPQHLFELLNEGHWPSDPEQRSMLIATLVFGPWERYREGFRARVAGRYADRPAVDAALTAEFARMSIQGERGMPWIGSTNRPRTLNAFHEACARMLYAALKLEHEETRKKGEPKKTAQQLRDSVRLAMGIHEEVDDKTIQRILRRGTKAG